MATKMSGTAKVAIGIGLAALAVWGYTTYIKPKSTGTTEPVEPTSNASGKKCYCKQGGSYYQVTCGHACPEGVKANF